jgi:hypothetical protein
MQILSVYSICRIYSAGAECLCLCASVWFILRVFQAHSPRTAKAGIQRHDAHIQRILSLSLHALNHANECFMPTVPRAGAGERFSFMHLISLAL